MGYLCPVCDTPQPDGEHLANHVAITAIVRDEDHAAWLDDHAEGWRDASPAELAADLVDHVERIDYDEAAVAHADVPESAREEDGHAYDHGEEDHDHDPADADVDVGVHRDHDAYREGGIDGAGAGEFDAVVEEAIEEAREMTRQQFEDAAVEGDDEAEDEAGDGQDDGNGDEE